MQKTLKKVLEELNKDNPRLDYIRGMLEVLVEDEPMYVTTTDPKNPIKIVSPVMSTGDDLPSMSKSYIENIQKISNESQE